MIEVIYDGNLGNNLFQYAFGRILAGQLGYRLKAQPINGFPRTTDVVEGDVVTGDPIVLRGQRPNLTKLRETPRRPILLTGYFQRSEYYVGYRSEVCEWFAMNYDGDDGLEPEDLVVGIRRGWDYIPRHGLPLSYYRNAIDAVPHRRLHFCSDSPHDPFVKFLAERYGAIVHAPSPLANLYLLRRARKLIVANSTFLWWGAFLSDADPIIYPIPQNGLWSDNDLMSKNIALTVDDPRYVYVHCDRYRSEFLSERLRVARTASTKRVKDAIRPLLWFKKPYIPSRPYRFQEDE